MKTWGWIAIITIALSGCGKKQEAGEKEPEPVLTVETAQASVKSIRELVPIDGSYVLSSTDFAKLAPVTSGKLQTMYAKEGDKVKKGQLLAKIDTQVLDAQQRSAAANSAAAQALASQSESSLRAATADYEGAVRSAELNLQATTFEQNSNIEQAQVELDRLRAGARPQEISQAQQAVRQAQVNRDKAYADAERDKKLFAEGFVSGQQADASKAAYEVAESALTQAKDQLQLVKLGARPEEIKAAELRLRSARDLGSKRIEAAKATLGQAKKSRLSLQAKSQEVRAAQLNASGKSADSSAAKGLVANGEIRAPFDGTIVRRILGPGNLADSTIPVFEIAKAGAHIEFAGQASPRIASQLSEGMAVITEGSDEPNGILRSIGVADALSGQVPLRVVFGQPPLKVSAGAFARVNVVLRTILSAVVVPEAAVVTREDKKVIFVVESGEAKMREVEVGPTEQGQIVILKGVRKGEKVVLVGVHEISDGAKVQEAAKEAKAEGKE